ncbi:NUDIX domain-containing protein [Nonomuraea sp. NPDC046802]|uniref:NUDIX hydrolase n=1 Tax=Nonomuraea sp. NPDC046802 TaxID=3154919 RepID=UPI0033CBC2D1
MRTRQSARIVLLDRDERVLMIQVRDDGVIVVPGQPVPELFWIPPGGGLEPGESFLDAARRELFEETGLSGVDWGPCLWTRDRNVHWSGEPVHVHERYFLARVRDDAAVSRDHLQPAERDTITGHRWWPQAELAAAEAILRPPGLPGLLADVVNANGRLPSEPLALDV